MVPQSECDIEVSWVDDLTYAAQLWLKENCGDALITNNGYVNAVVLDTMYFEPKHQSNEAASAHKEFLATKP